MLNNPKVESGMIYWFEHLDKCFYRNVEYRCTSCDRRANVCAEGCPIQYKCGNGSCSGLMSPFSNEWILEGQPIQKLLFGVII